jgi:predicted TIM-barrel fold metal-dependent hydrolase
MYTRRVFDFHARLAPATEAAGQLLSTMDRCGIERAVICAGGVVDIDRLAFQIVNGGRCMQSANNDAVLRAAELSHGRLVPFYFGNPHVSVRDYRRHATQFRGLELSPAVHGVGFYHSGVRELVEVAREYGHPVYTVCVPTPGGGTDDLGRLAADYPDVVFAFGHCGFIAVDTYALTRLAPYPNVVAEISGCFGVTARLAVQRLGADRVLFGTEYPLQPPEAELAKLAALRLSPADEQLVAWENAHRLLKLPYPRPRAGQMHAAAIPAQALPDAALPDPALPVQGGRR